MSRVTVNIDGTELSAIEAHYVVSRANNPQGLRVADSMRAKAFFYADIRDAERNRPDDVLDFWKMASDTEDDIHSVEIRFFETDNKVLNTVKFKGWISVFETLTPPLVSSATASGAGGFGGGGRSMEGVELPGNLLYCEISVVLDKKNMPYHEMTR